MLQRIMVRPKLDQIHDLHLNRSCQWMSVYTTLILPVPGKIVENAPSLFSELIVELLESSSMDLCRNKKCSLTGKGNKQAKAKERGDCLKEKVYVIW